jgi:signal transduction histidine kinase
MNLPRETSDCDPVYELVATALEQKELSGLLKLLELLCDDLEAYGCALWEVTPMAHLNLRSSQGKLFVVAEWFRDGRSAATHDMPIDQSVNGWSILNQATANVPDMDNDARVYKTSMVRDFNFRSMCAVPVSLSDGKGSLSLYRNELKPFTEEEIARVEKMASLLPALFHAIRSRASQRLIQSVSEALSDAEPQLPDDVLSPDEMKELLHKICFRISDTFQCIETSIFLKPNPRASNSFVLQATTWPEWSEFKKKVYEANKSEGITGWVLEHRTPVHIFSLGDFKRDKKFIRRSYPEMVWRDSLDIKASAREILNLQPDEGLQPLSFMAVPILRGQKVLGVIRCCTARKAPYYFAGREVQLLELVAAQLSYFWSNWLIRRRVQDENRMWQALVSYVGELNDSVQKQLEQNLLDEKVIFAQALKKLSRLIKEAEILDVRLYHRDTKDLRFAVTHGKAWREGTEAEIKERLEKRFPVPSELVNFPLGVRVFQENKPRAILDAQKDGYLSQTFPQTKQFIAAPITVRNKKIGVLGLRNASEHPFPPNILEVAELLGQQLGLYNSLIDGMREARTAEGTMKKQDKILRQTSQDLTHQLKGPIQQAHTRVQKLLSRNLNNDYVDSRLLEIRGLIRKAERVTSSTSAFAQLAEKETLEFKTGDFKRLSYDELMKMLREASADNMLLIESYRQIKFDIEDGSFTPLKAILVETVEDLLEQAVNCLLDNAGKYSYPGTKIRVFGGLTKSGRFHISVSNTGFPIKPNELLDCVKRGWRSEDAESTTGEGSGIGLWFVDHVMKGQGGELIITPTNDHMQTQVSLVFPVKK